MKLRNLGTLGAAALFVFSACTPSGASQTPKASGSGGDTSKGTINIAIDLPLQGSDKAASDPIIKGVRLAVKEAGGAIAGWAVTVPDSVVFDDAVNGAHDPQTGARNMQSAVANADIVALIGPLNSSVAKTEIPITNEAGLLQCSPANTTVALTKPPAALDIRKAKPNDINYIRVVTTDDFQGPAAAKFIIDNLKKTKVAIIDDTETFGKGIADSFEAEFKKDGGEVVFRQGVPKTTGDYNPILTQAASKKPDSIYFGGVTATGGARILKAAVAAGLGDIPYFGPDGINDGSGTSKDSFLNLAGADAKNAYSTLAGIGDFPAKADFNAKYKAEYQEDATGYASTGYACAQVVLDGIKRAAATNPADKAAWRAAVRKATVDTAVTYKTILGDITFDANGDTSQHIISVYSFDAAGAAGKGDWKFFQQLDFAKP